VRVEAPQVAAGALATPAVNGECCRKAPRMFLEEFNPEELGRMQRGWKDGDLLALALFPEESEK
jgi:hypothetical protein